MTTLAYIPDGYTEDGFIAAEPGIHPAVHFSYRPMLHEEVVQVDVEAARKNGSNQPAARALAEKIVQWDITDPKGQPLAVGFEVLTKLRGKLFLKLWAIVAGFRASDDAPASETGQAKLEADLKNSD
jgi:hypothetical protein